mgnify:CR=1 FL=1
MTAFPPRPRAWVELAADDDAAPDPKEVITEATRKMKKSVASLQESLSTLRVGRANPSLLDRVQVDYYGAPTLLNSLASITAPSASQLVVDVYDKAAIGDVEKALFESDIGMTPNNDGKVIRLNVPALTEEVRHREQKDGGHVHDRSALFPLHTHHPNMSVTANRTRACINRRKPTVSACSNHMYTHTYTHTHTHDTRTT